MCAQRAPVNYALLFPYALPYFAYVLVLGRAKDWGGEVLGYALAAVATGAALAWAIRWFLPLRGNRSPTVSVALGVAAGLAGTALWVLLKTPFIEDPTGEPWEPDAFAWRLGVSALLVPLVEEWLFRGFLLRGASQWWLARREGVDDPLGLVLHERSVHTLPATSWTVFGVLFSSLVFAAGHGASEWLAALAYGLLMAALVVSRGDLLSAVVAHGVTNASLAVYVRATGTWGVW